jgi:hypothetical protein
MHVFNHALTEWTDGLAWLGHDASPIVRRSKMPRYIKDSTMSIYIDGLKDGTRYRESGLVLGHFTAD